MKRFYYLLSMLALIVAGMLCLTSCGDDELDCIEVESYRRAVDLGLPSRTLWANMNVGASENTAFGAYFAWGETAPKKKYDWYTYKYENGQGRGLAFTKYCSNSGFGYNGFTDNKTELDFDDDAAYVNWGKDWRMPSRTQFEELVDSKYTKTRRGTVNGVKGLLITSRSNGNSIFLPASGYRDDIWSEDALPIGIGDLYYWSRTLDSGAPHGAWDLCFHSSSAGMNRIARFHGVSVRPVRNQ